MNILGIIQSIPLERKVTVTTLTIFILLVGLFSTSALASSVDINIFKFLYSSDSPDSTDIPDIPDAPTEDQPEPTELSEPPEPTEQSMKSKLFRDWEPIQWAGKGPAPPQLLTVNITALGNTIYINTSKYAVGVGNNTIYTSYGSIVEYYSNDFNQSDDISDNYIANYIQLRRAGGGGPVDVIPNLIANPNMSIQENGTQRAYLRYDWNSNEAVIHWYFYEDYYVGRFQSAISTTTYNDGIEILQVINDTNSTGGFDADGLTTANGSKASDDTTTPSTDSFPDLYDQTNDYWVTWFGTQANNLAVGRIGQAMPTGGNNIYSDLTDLETTGSDYFDQLWGASNNLTSYDDMFTITVLHNGSSQQTVEFLYSLYENPATIANFANTVNLSYNSKEFIYNASRSSPTANAIINVTGNAAWNRTNENIYIKFNNIDSTTSVWNSTDNVTWNLLYNNNMQFESNYVIFNVNQSRDNWMLYSVGNVTPTIDADGDGFDSTVDCNDSNATIRPLFNNTINNLSASIKICKDYYTNVTILINSSNLYIDGNGSTLNYTSSSDSNTIPDTINVSNTSPGLTNITIRNFGLIQTNVVAGLPMYTIQLPNVSVVTVTNNTLRTNETNQLNGFGDNWTIVNNTFNHTFLDTVNAGTGISSTVLAAGSNWNISKNFFVGGYIQIHITSADAPTNTAENWTISYNNFTSSYHENTFLTGLSNGTVHHNYMYNNSRTSPGCTGIWCYRGIYEPNSQQMDIYNNSVRNSPLAYLSAGQYNRWYNNSAENVTWGFYIGGNTQFQNITENNITNTTYGFYTALSTFYPDNVRNNTITRNTITNVSIDGIHFRTHTLGPNGNNTFSHNFINRTSTAQAGYGIYHHQNGTLPQTTGELRNNTIIGFVTAGIYIIDTQIGALDIVDNNITSTKLASVGLLTNGIDKANISNNTIDVIRYGIILTNTSNTTINKNSVTNITLLLSDHNNLSNMTFNNLNLTSSDNNNMTNINTTKVIFNMSTSNYMINGTNLGGKNSIRIDTSGSNKLLNFTHSFSNIQQINCGIPCPNIQGWWYVRANVTNTSGSPMNGATVRFNTSGDVSLFNTTTDATGITPFGLVMAYSQTQFLTNNSNFTAHANLTGLTKNSSFPQLLDSSRMFQIQLIDNLPPTIYLINYTNASTFTYKSPHNLSFNVTDPEQVNTSVTLFRDSSTNISFNASVQNNTLSNFSNVSFPLGTHSFWFSSNDGSATNVSFNYSITINQNPPVLNIVNFTNQSNFTGTPSIEFNMTDDQNSTTICNFFTNVTGNFSQNNSVQNNTISNFNLSGLADGSYMFWLTCNDGSAINATVTTGFYTFTQDTTLPTMLFYNTSTENNTILEQNWFFVNFTAQDNINIENTTLLLESGGTNISELNLNKFDRDIFNSSWWFNFTQMQTKVYNIRAIANDSLGNRQTANRTIILQYGSGATGGTGIGASSGLQNITNITEEPPIITGALVTPTGFAGKLINLPFPTKILLLGILTICLIILADEREEKKKHRKRIQKLAEASAKNKPKTI